MNKTMKMAIRLMLVGVVTLAFFVSSSRPSPAAAQMPGSFELRDHPIYLIASYYNAIALHDYARAYSYWNGHAPGGATYQQFAAGFADVQTVRALARLPVAGEGAAGTIHAEVPVVVLTTLHSGESQIFAGCFHVVHYNVPIGDPPVTDPNWYLNSAVLEPAASADFEQATNACSLAESFPTSTGIDNQLSPLDLISSYYDAIAAHDYARAYQYWPGGAPGQTLTQFAQGFAGTENIGVVVALSFTMGAAAGSVYADTPLLITATDEDEPQLFVGCIVARKSNVPVGDSTTPDPNWYLYSANIDPVSTLDSGIQQVWDICSNP
jgi:hypothetical protein